jgi:hypothetical protein
LLTLYSAPGALQDSRSKISNLSRATKAKLYDSGFPDIVDYRGKAPVEMGSMSNLAASMPLPLVRFLKRFRLCFEPNIHVYVQKQTGSDPDAFQGYEVVIQFLAFARVSDFLTQYNGIISSSFFLSSWLS